MRTDNQAIKDAEAQEKQAQDTLAALKARQGQLTEELGGGGGGSGSSQAEALERIKQKDTEIQGFMEHFEEAKAGELRSIASDQTAIVELLDRTSRGLTLQQHMPSQAQVQQMREELAFKQEQKDTAEATLEKVKSAPHPEFWGFHHADDPIPPIHPIPSQQDDLQRYSNLDALRESMTARRKSTVEERARLVRRAELVRAQADTLSAQVEANRQQMAKDPALQQLEAKERRLRQYQEMTHHLRETIEAKSREAAYDHLKKDCLRLVDELNGLVIKGLQ
ncbi:putative Intraflagellar Transport Protein 72/74 [Paratrimastix pyriformis]|uniref:Intraflagellar Transport Protein 72/74 n=1 Tax=Paratrimastix pyriformis TaxID=342808 RepID=A0ABQ8UAK9_9EUKA|nr:putative Intraflagellar Transport Protein 72/74 [Paratrimastix pyriformis]